MSMANNGSDLAERWRALAREVLEVADAMTDSQIEEEMWKVALWYERLAKHAELRRHDGLAEAGIEAVGHDNARRDHVIAK